MDAFAKARAKYEKNRTSQGRGMPNTDINKVPEKKEDPEATLPPLPVSVPQVMEVSVSGPFTKVYKVYYGGTVLASQEKQLPAMVKKALGAFGRVDDSA